MEKQIDLTIQLWEKEVERLKLVQQLWFSKGVPECANNLQWQIFGIEKCIADLKKLLS